MFQRPAATRFAERVPKRTRNRERETGNGRIRTRNRGRRTEHAEPRMQNREAEPPRQWRSVARKNLGLMSETRNCVRLGSRAEYGPPSRIGFPRRCLTRLPERPCAVSVTKTSERVRRALTARLRRPLAQFSAPPRTPETQNPGPPVVSPSPPRPSPIPHADACLALGPHGRARGHCRWTQVVCVRDCRP
jgi:hypothetical protein